MLKRSMAALLIASCSSPFRLPLARRMMQLLRTLARSCVRQFSSTVTTTCRGRSALTGWPGDVAKYDLRTTTSGQTDLARLKLGGVGGRAVRSVYIPGETGSGSRVHGASQVDVRTGDMRIRIACVSRRRWPRSSRCASCWARRLDAGNGRRARHRRLARRTAGLLRSRCALHDVDAQRAHELGGLAASSPVHGRTSRRSASRSCWR